MFDDDVVVAKTEVRRTSKYLYVMSLPPLPRSFPLMLVQCPLTLSSQAGQARLILQARCRAYLSTLPLMSDDLSRTRKDAHQTLRVRKDSKERDLPLPPILDPIAIERRNKWENTKAQPVAADFTDFQKKLQANPYGNNRCNAS